MSPDGWIFVITLWMTRVMEDGAVLGPVRFTAEATTEDRCNALRDILKVPVRNMEATMGKCHQPGGPK